MTIFILTPQRLIATIVAIGAQSLSAMVNPVKTVRGHRHILTYIPKPSITTAKVCLLITIMLAVVNCILTGCVPTQAAETGPDTHAPTLANPLTYDEGARIAIRQSPFFTKSSVEIDIRRMDETDSRYGMIPPLTFRTYYYVNQPENVNTRPYSLNFSMDPYNPFGSYYSLQAQKLATQMAILAHLAAVSQGLENLGKFYLQLDYLKKTTAYQTALVNLDKEILTFAENRMSIGTGTSLEVKVAQQQLQLSQSELQQIKISEKRTLATMKQFLGLPPPAEVNPDLKDTRRQVLGEFNPTTADFEQAKKNSYELKGIEIQKKLQGYKILMAKAKVMPNLLFNTQTPDPLNATANYGLYVSVGLEIPVWDGFKRIRDISRQKAVLKQVNANKEEKEMDLQEKWNSEKDATQAANAALKIAQSREELANLKARQDEIRYQSGEVNLPVSLESRKKVIEAQKETSKNNLNYDLTILKLRELSGDLGNTYVDSNSWQK